MASPNIKEQADLGRLFLTIGKLGKIGQFPVCPSGTSFRLMTRATNVFESQKPLDF
jgi:hypothetical protein